MVFEDDFEMATDICESHVKMIARKCNIFF